MKSFVKKKHEVKNTARATLMVPCSSNDIQVTYFSNNLEECFMRAMSNSIRNSENVLMPYIPSYLQTLWIWSQLAKVLMADAHAHAHAEAADPFP